MTSIVLTKEQREAIVKAKAEGKQRIRMDLTPSQKEEMAKLDAEVDAEKSAINVASKAAKSKHDARVDQIAKLLCQARVDAGLSLSQLAELTGMTRQALSRVESGENRNPTLATINRIAEALNKDLILGLQDAA